MSPEKKWMLTNPTFDMYEVFQKSLLPASYIPHEKVSEYFRENIVPQENEAEEKWYWYTQHFYLGKRMPKSIILDLQELANMFPINCLEENV